MIDEPGSGLNQEEGISASRGSCWQRFEPGGVSLAALLLSPVLLAQGIMTRRSVPKLPEPAGARDGTKGSGPPLRLMILGDSAAAGVGAAHQDDALLGQLVSRLAEEFRVTWSLRARTGNTTSAALEWLETQPPAPFDVVLTSLGVNDVTSTIGRSRWRRQQAQLRSMLKNKFGADTLLISGLPPLHGFPALPQPLRWLLGARATQFNRALGLDIAADGGADFLDIRFTDDMTLMASDGFHPGPGAYAQWAEHVAALIKRR